MIASPAWVVGLEHYQLVSCLSELLLEDLSELVSGQEFLVREQEVCLQEQVKLSAVDRNQHILHQEFR